MTTTTVDIGKTPTQLADLLSLALSGTEVIIAEDDKPLARLVPVVQEQPRPAAFWTGTDLETAYRQMAADESREAEALEWAEATVGDVSDEAR